ncbi:MAG TPA: ABC transporter ATP-binding protein [Symbiobacteriaceae bacterium]|nr:ABC transporter ATP-binding protein [Symbiobacteriaceae bacterium]
MLKIEGLQKQYGTFQAVKGIDLHIEAGAIFGLIGPNGAGKTTTMKMIATLLRPTAGKIVMGEIDVTRRPEEARRRMGYMPDFFGVYDDLKVSEYMEFYGDCHRVPRAGRERLIGDLLELVNLSHKKDAYVDGLSRGMKQRLCLARCLIHDPELLILDEPASGLDPRARVEMREILQELRRMGKTILISSHILAELAEICTDIGIVADGRLSVSGPVGQVLRRAGARLIEVRVAGDPAEAAIRAGQLPGLSSVQQTEHGLRIELDGEDEAVAQLLAGLVGAGVPVIHFAELQSKLEEVFMAVTGGEAK